MAISFSKTVSTHQQWPKKEQAMNFRQVDVGTREVSGVDQRHVNPLRIYSKSLQVQSCLAYRHYI